VSPGFSSTYWLQALLVIALAARQPRCGAEQVARRGLWVVRERMWGTNGWSSSAGCLPARMWSQTPWPTGPTTWSSKLRG